MITTDQTAAAALKLARDALAELLSAIDNAADVNDDGEPVPWTGYVGGNGDRQAGDRLDSAIAIGRAAIDALPASVPSGEPADIDEAQLARLSERGAVAWAGVTDADVQALREGDVPGAMVREADLNRLLDSMADSMISELGPNGRELAEMIRVGIPNLEVHAASFVRAVRAQALEDAARLADARMKTIDDVRRHEAEAIAWLIRELKGSA